MPGPLVMGKPAVLWTQLSLSLPQLGGLNFRRKARSDQGGTPEPMMVGYVSSPAQIPMGALAR